MNNIIKCKHCGKELNEKELIKTVDLFQRFGNRRYRYASWKCPYCKKLAFYTIKHKLYWNEDNKQYLELNDNHTLWYINCKDFDEYEYEFIVSQAIKAMEKKHKNLKVYLLGRSGRHVCVEDTPVNRRRYLKLIKTAVEQERWVIDWFNNKDKEVK